MKFGLYSRWPKISVQFYNPITNHWVSIKNLVCKSFEPCQVKYILKDLDDIEPDDSLQNQSHVNPLW